VTINNLHDMITLIDNGTWTAIWFPSKSVLNGVQTKGCKRIAAHSIQTGSNAWTDQRWNVGARLRKIRCPRVTSFKISHASGSWRSIIFRVLYE
jgi:hypothetical protein